MLLSSFPSRQEIRRQNIHLRNRCFVRWTFGVSEFAAARTFCTEKWELLISHNHRRDTAVGYSPLGHADLLTLNTEEYPAHLVRAKENERRTVTV